MKELNQLFEIKCSKCGSNNCYVSSEVHYDYDYDDNLITMGEYYTIKCEDCSSEYSSL